MRSASDTKKKIIGLFPDKGVVRWLVAVIFSILIIALNFFVHASILKFIVSGSLQPLLLAIIAIIWGVVGVYSLHLSLNFCVSLYPYEWSQRLQHLIFIGPAITLLIWLLLLPALRTLRLSFLDKRGEVFIGLENYKYVFTERTMVLALQNTVIWVIVGTLSCVSLGLLIAILADRSSYEKIAKIFIFMPIAVSFVAASVIWKFIYAYSPTSDTQIGLLNAINTAMGGEPKAWLTMMQPWNNYFLMVILVWMMTGFAMVMFSAAIKNVPDESIEAARVDGASEIKIFFAIIIPYIKKTIIAVTTSITIFSMRVFDAVWVMTGGQYGTDVIATKFYKEYFTFNNSGTGSAIAMLLLVAIIPVILMNINQGKEEEY